MTGVYQYANRGQRLSISPSLTEEGGVFVGLAGTDCGVHVRPEHVAEVAFALCAQARGRAETEALAAILRDAGVREFRTAADVALRAGYIPPGRPR